jgi:hypothetical protein
LNAAYALTVRGAADMLERWSTECLLFWRLAGVASMANCRMRLSRRRTQCLHMFGTL